MPYPVGITTRAVTMGGATALESAEPLILQAIIQSSRGLIWGASGWRFPSLARTVTSTAGAEITVELPVTDLPGWRLIDAEGSILDVSVPGSYTHTYTVTLIALSAANKIVSQRILGPFVLPTGDGSPVDLDALLPVGTQAGGVVLVPDTWGPLVVAAEAAAATAEGHASTVALYAIPGETATATTARINAALALGGTVRIRGDFTTNGPLIIPSDTTLDARTSTITLAPGSTTRMLSNAAFQGTGDRDHDIEIIGGTWDRGANTYSGNHNAHTIAIHRADRVYISDVRHIATGSVKYSIYLCDANDATVERCNITSTSDGVHVTGPASHITVRDIIGTTDDDLVSYTGRDYPTWELTPGGGNITDTLTERITHTGGAYTANVLKMVPGKLMTMSGMSARKLVGTMNGFLVSILSDEHQDSTTGGLVKDVQIEDMEGTGVDIAANCEAVTLRNLRVTTAGMVRAISVNKGTGTNAVTVGRLSVDGMRHHSGAAPSACLIHVATGCTADAVVASDIVAACPTLVVDGGASTAALSHVQQSAGTSLATFSGTQALTVTLADVAATTTSPSVVLYGNAAMQLHLAGVALSPVNGRIAGNYSTSGSITLRGHVIGGSHSTAVYRNATQVSRVVGAELKGDVSTLTPAAGDIAYNTNAALGCGVGVVISNGTLWKNLYTGATT